jgi:predicted Zn-dependent peptidase
MKTMRNSKTILLVAIALVAALAALPAAAQAKSYKSIKYPELPEFKVNKPEVYTMPNGLKVFLMEDHELPMIDVSMRIRTGSNYEPAEKTGLADLFGQVQREGGTTSMSGDEMDEYLALRAATVETGMGGDSGFASMNAMTDNFDEVFTVFVEVVRNPIFAEDKIEVAKTQHNSVISRRNDDVGGITGREFQRVIYGPDSALGRMTEYETIAEVSRDDLLAWHKKYYHPNNAYVGVVGDFDSRMMKGKLESSFGDWEKGPEFNEPEVPFNRSLKPGVFFVEKEDVTQAQVRIGHLGIEVSDTPDYYATQVMNEVFGGGFASRLFSTVRSEKGLAYMVFGGVGSGFAREGVFQVGLSTQSGKMAESVDALKIEIDRMINTPPDKAELSKAKESILNSFVFRYDSQERILNQLMFYDFWGLPEDFLDTYRSKIEKVTAEDVGRVAKQYMHPDKLAVLVVGKSADFDKPVSTFGEVTEIDITIPPPPDTQPVVLRSPANLEAGRALFAKMVDGMTESGAAEIASVVSDSTIAFSLGGQTMSLTQDMSLVLPDKLHQTIKTPMGDQMLVINGDQGYMKAGGQTQPLPGSAIEDQLKDLGRELLVLMGNRDNPEMEALAAGSDNVDGTSCDLMAVNFMGSESRICVADDGTVIRQSYQGKHPMQQTPGMIEVRFSEYSEISGHLIAHKQVMTFEGQPLATITLNSIELNPDIDSTIFEMPEN